MSDSKWVAITLIITVLAGATVGSVASYSIALQNCKAMEFGYEQQADEHGNVLWVKARDT